MGVFIIAALCLFCFVRGGMLIFAKDAAWQSVVWRHRSEGVASERTPQWDASATGQGVVMIGLGLSLLLFLPRYSVRSSPPVPQAGQVTVTIDGRTPTPQEQDELNQEFKDGVFKDANGKPVKPGR